MFVESKLQDSLRLADVLSVARDAFDVVYDHGSVFYVLYVVFERKHFAQRHWSLESDGEIDLREVGGDELLESKGEVVACSSDVRELEKHFDRFFQDLLLAPWASTWTLGTARWTCRSLLPDIRCAKVSA